MKLMEEKLNTLEAVSKLSKIVKEANMLNASMDEDYEKLLESEKNLNRTAEKILKIKNTTTYSYLI